VAVAAVTALLVGGAAGFGGSILARSVTEESGSVASPSVSTQSNPAPEPTRRTPVPRPPQTLDTVAVARAAVPSTVMLRVGTGEDGVVGSGFIISADGLIMTNSHVVAGADDGARIRVAYSDGSRSSAKLLGRTATYDLAVVKVTGKKKLTPLPIGDSDATEVGERVIAIGAPLALDGTVTEGIISAVQRPVAVGDDDDTNAYINSLQTDAPINPGNSGGPLIDAGGRVIGVNSAILTLSEGQRSAGNIGLGFAIPINQAMDIGQRLIKDGEITYPVIDADVEATRDQVGVAIRRVQRGGPAAKAGLRAGDVVLKVEDRTVDSVAELVVAIRVHHPGDRVTLTYRRNGKVAETAVTLGGRKG
jgi:putative serine protease PepD